MNRFHSGAVLLDGLAHIRSLGSIGGTDSRAISVISVNIHQGFLEQDMFTRVGNPLAALQGWKTGHD